MNSRSTQLLNYHKINKCVVSGYRVAPGCAGERPLPLGGVVCVGVERSVESCEDVSGCVVVYLLVSLVPPFPFTGRVMREREPGRRARPRGRWPGPELHACPTRRPNESTQLGHNIMIRVACGSLCERNPGVDVLHVHLLEMCSPAFDLHIEAI